ncbi:MAG: sugar phosphate isomerase/epimerase [Treponema sp.]|jgi:sugar phosphate isomerase/epimerase|nr:sugar phosphate isomerase/epimerase [Treponema sp.]
MFTLTGFADEISPDPAEQAEAFRDMGIRYLDFRGAWKKNVLELTDAELDEYRRILSDYGIGVSCIGSPVGKTGIDEDPAAHEKQFNRAVEVALRFGVKYIRVFSFYLKPEQRNESAVKERIFKRIRSMGETAAANKLVLVHENEADIYGEGSGACRELLDALASPSFRAVFDPCNFIMANEAPFTECFPRIAPYIEYLHIKDALRETKVIVKAGEGDGEIREILNSLRNRSLFVSLEPHLALAGRNAGFSGLDLFRGAHRALVTILDELKIEYC